MENISCVYSVAHQEQIEVQQAAEQQRQQQLIIIQQQQQQAAAEAEARRLEEERQRQAEVKKEVSKKEHVVKKEVIKVTKTEPVKRKVHLSSSSTSSASSSSSRSLSELHALRLRLEGAEDMLSQHIHICLGDDGVQDCGLKITQLEVDTKTHKFKKNRRACSTENESDPKDLFPIFTAITVFVCMFPCRRCSVMLTRCVTSTYV